MGDSYTQAKELHTVPRLPTPPFECLKHYEPVLQRRALRQRTLAFAQNRGDIAATLKSQLISQFTVLRDIPGWRRGDPVMAEQVVSGMHRTVQECVLPLREVVAGWGSPTPTYDWDQANDQSLRAEVGSGVKIDSGYVGPNSQGRLPLSFIAATDEQLAWADVSEPQTICRLDLRAVVKVEEDSKGRFRLAAENQAGKLQVVEVGAVAQERGQLISSLIDSLKSIAPFYEADRAIAMRFSSLQGVPVNRWEACPCGG